MTESLENRSRAEASESRQTTPERQVSRAEARDFRIQEIDQRLKESGSGSGGPDRAAMTVQKESEMVAAIDPIEKTLGKPVSEESRAMIHANMVEAPLAQAAASDERRDSMRAERAELALDRAADALDYASPEALAKVAALGAKDEKGRHVAPPYVYPATADAPYAVIGTAHMRDASSPMARGVSAASEKFFAENNADDVVVMIEGKHGGYDAEAAERDLTGVQDEAGAIAKLGEGGAALWRAHEARAAGKRVEVESPERNGADIAADLMAQGHNPDDLGLYLAVRQFSTEFGQDALKDVPREQRMLKFAREFYDFDKQSGAGWISAESRQLADAAITSRNFEALGQLVPRIISEYADGANRTFASQSGREGMKLIPSAESLALAQGDDAGGAERVPIDQVNALFNPRSGETAVNAVSAAWLRERDKHVLRRMDDAMKRGKKPLLVFGGAHAVGLEPALKKLNE